jgi:hypothetical protein
MNTSRLAVAFSPVFALLASAATGACFPPDDNQLPNDAGFDVLAFDGALSDAPTYDAATHDGSTADATPDASTSDASLADASTNDADAAVTYVGGAGDSMSTVSFGMPQGGRPIGAASNDGSAMLVFYDYNSQNMSFSHYDVATGWTSIAPLDTGTPSHQTEWPILAMDGSGNAFLAWSVIDNNNFGTLNVLRYDHASHAWGALAHPDPYAQSLSGASVMAVSQAGEALIVVNHCGANDIVAQCTSQSAVHYAGGAWTTEAVSGVMGLGPIAIRMADNGNAVLLSSMTTGYSLFTRDTGGTWTAGPTGIYASAAQTDVGINASGDTIFAYITSGPQVYQRAGGGAWSGPHATTGTNQGASSCGLPVLVTTTGDAFVTQCSQNGNTETIAYAHGTATWGAPSKISALVASLEYDSTGNMLGTYENSAMVVTAKYAVGGGWTGPSAPLSGITNSGSVAFVAPNGRGWVTWAESQIAQVKKVQ